MFEDSLVESTGRIRTRSKWFAIGSFLLQAALLTALILIPFFYPAALPKQALTMMLVAPPPPPTRPDLPTHAATARTASPAPLAALTAPTVIPRHVAMVDDRPPGTIDISSADNRSGPRQYGCAARTGHPASASTHQTRAKAPSRTGAHLRRGRSRALDRAHPARLSRHRPRRAHSGNRRRRSDHLHAGNGGACPRGKRSAHTGQPRH